MPNVFNFMNDMVKKLFIFLSGCFIGWLAGKPTTEFISLNKTSELSLLVDMTPLAFGDFCKIL